MNFYLKETVFAPVFGLFAAKRTAFYCKQPEKWCKCRFWGIYIHFTCMYNAPPFASEPTFARIDFLRQGERLVIGKGTQNVKFLTENQTKEMMPHTSSWLTAQKARRLTTASASGCRACCTHQRRQYHGNVQVARHWQPVFNLQRKVLKVFRSIVV